MERDEIITKLKKLYEIEHIAPKKEFNCKKKDVCNVIGNDLALGMQCHVGTKYGQGKHKLLVVSLDCGNGGADNIDDRTNDVESCKFSNPHMRGTGKIISDFYGIDRAEALKYFAMTNSCKCSRKDSPNQLEYRFHFNCADYKQKEIEILDPDVIYFQGVNSRAGFEGKFKEMNNIRKELSEFIKQIDINGKNYPAIICIHPSARGRHSKVAKKFYDETIHEINKYIKENIIKR
ncbi:MAG: hypothetical protein ABFC28_09050 [Rikenellaceae bacterium]